MRMQRNLSVADIIAQQRQKNKEEKRERRPETVFPFAQKMCIIEYVQTLVF